MQDLVAKREAHLKDCGTGTGPDGGELAQRIDKWREILEEENTRKEASASRFSADNLHEVWFRVHTSLLEQ